MDKLIVVTGGGGFIGGHLVASLRKAHLNIRAVDIKPQSEWFQTFDDVECRKLDLREREACRAAVNGASDVYNLAADMGGMGFIEHNKTRCMLSVLINTHMLMAAAESQVARYFFASSACVYSGQKQSKPDVAPLKAEDAYPAFPEDGYGWEKLFSERMCRHFYEEHKLSVRIARYHNVYGPQGTYRGGREKAPAAICRKVIEAKFAGADEIEIWGDGRQTRSFQYIEDCIEGTRRLMDSDFVHPINIGSSELVSIDRLVDIVEEIAGVKLNRKYRLDAPKGVAGRNSDNTLIKEILNWEPSTSLRRGMEITYQWIANQMRRERRTSHSSLQGL